MGSYISRMRYQCVRSEYEMWSNDEDKLDAKMGVQAPYLSQGFGDFGGCREGKWRSG